MTLRKLTTAAAFTLAARLALPAAAEAGHRHSRHCRHRYAYEDYRPVYRPAPRYYYYDDYDYRYRQPYRSYRYSRPYGYDYGYGRPAFHYHRGVRCSRPHLSIHLD